MKKQIQIDGKRGKLNCLLFEPMENTAHNPLGNQVSNAIGNMTRSAGGNPGSGRAVQPVCPATKSSVLFLPGMPGTDQSEDIAEDLCRMNYRVLCLSYSGSCGSDGEYSISHMLEDSETAFQFLAEKGDSISILGHSMGGFVCAQLAAKHPQETRAVIMLFPCDIGRLPIWEREAFMTSEVVKDFFYTHASTLRGTTSDRLLNEVFENADTYSLVQLAPVLSQIPILMIGGSKDFYSPPSLNCQPLAEAVRKAGGEKLQYQEYSTGHYGDGSRNMISRNILMFLEA